jgi:hypothetical protein
VESSLTEFLKKDDLTESEAACLAALVISTVGHVDLFVSGKLDMYICREKQALEYEEAYYRQMLKQSDLRWKLIKKTWLKMLEDESFDKKLNALLKK